MLIDGPGSSLGGASRLLCVYCPRVSFSVREEIVKMLLRAIVWSVFSRFVEAVVAFNAPAPRELVLLTSYRLYRTAN